MKPRSQGKDGTEEAVEGDLVRVLETQKLSAEFLFDSGR